MASANTQTSLESPVPPAAEIERFVNDLNNFLESVRGLTIGTRRKYCRIVKRFLTTWHSGEKIEWKNLSADPLRKFVSQELRSKKRPSNSPCVALRAMLGFLDLKGLCPTGLADSLPRIRRWRHANLPETLSTDQVSRVLQVAAVEENSHVLRDHAIVILLAKTGMRAKEVTNLTLNDLDWRNGVVHVRDAKSRHDRDLPLTRDVGRAILSYLQHERGQSEHQKIFLGAIPRCSPILDSSTISKIVKRVLAKADIKPGRGAAHLLRHAAATNMLKGGASFKSIADVLGHHSLDSTTIYAKLDLPRLSEIAMPWPGDAT